MNKILVIVFLILFKANALAVDASRPDRLVKTLTNQVVAKLKREKPKLDKNPAQVGKVARQLAYTVKPHWDRVRTAAYIIGKPWARASKRDKKTFLKEFESLLIRTYSKALLKYADQKIEHLPYRHRSGTNANVKSRFIQSGGAPVNITYSLYKHKAKGWRVYNVKVGGFDLVVNFKNQYSPIVRKSGLAGLNKVLKSKR